MAPPEITRDQIVQTVAEAPDCPETGGSDAQESVEVEHNVRACLDHILNQKDVPAFSHNLCKVMGLMGDDETSMRLITNTVLQDYSLTLAVLRRANSAQYNRSNAPICSVARAVTLLGVESLRNLVGAMLLLEKYSRRSVQLRKLLLLSLLTANHSRQVAARLEIPHAEQAYLCGMFWNLGEVLVAHYLPDRYSSILAAIEREGLSQESACLRVMGFRFEELGRAMAAAWNFPGAISSTMSRFNPILSRSKGLQDRLAAVVAFSRDLTEAVYDSDAGDSRVAISALAEKYASVVRLSPRALQEIMSCAISDTKETFSSAGVPINHLHLHRLSRTGPFADEPNAGPPAQVVRIDAVESSPHPDVKPSPTGDDGLLDQLLEEIKAAAESDATANLSQIVMMVLEACCRGAHFDRVIFGLTTPDRSMIRGRLGLGPGVEGMIDLFRVALSDPADPYANALAKQRDLFVDNSRPNAFQQSRPLQTLGVKSLSLYPVVVDRVVVGCLYLDRIHAGRPPSTRTLQTIGRLRDTLADVIARTRAGGSGKQ